MTKLSERHKFLSAALIFLIRDGQIFLMRRFNTGFADGLYSLPSGCVDANESATEAAIRETKEEAGIGIKLTDLTFAHTMFRKGDGAEWADYFFECKTWAGEPSLMETNKCDHVQWFDLDNLPENLVPFVRQAIDCYKQKIYYSEFGW